MDEELIRQLTEAVNNLNTALGASSDGLTTFTGATAGATTSLGQLEGANLQFIGSTLTAVRGVNAVLNQANRAASNATGSIESLGNQLGSLDPTGLTTLGTGPALLAEQQLVQSQRLTQQGVVLENIEQLLRLRGDLNITPEQAQQLFGDTSLLRAQGGLATDALENIAAMKQAVEAIPQAREDGTLVDGTRNLVQEMDALGFNTSQLTELFVQLGGVLGPAAAVNFSELLNEEGEATPESRQAVIDFVSTQEDLIKTMVELSQTTGMSVEAQVKATQAIAETPGMLSRQLRNINNPQFNQNLTRFANTLSAIGAGDLGENIISGLGLPIGNEIEAALKPQSFAMMQQINAMIASGADPEEIRAAERQLQQIYNRETTALVGELGAFAGVLGEEFGFLSRDAGNLRAALLSTAADPNSTAANQAAAQEAMNTRMSNEVIGTLTETRQTISGQTEQLVQAQADIVASAELVNTASAAIAVAAGTLADSIELLRPNSELASAETKLLNATVDDMVAEINAGTFNFVSDPNKEIAGETKKMLDDFANLVERQQQGENLPVEDRRRLQDYLNTDFISEIDARIADENVLSIPGTADTTGASFNLGAVPGAISDFVNRFRGDNNVTAEPNDRRRRRIRDYDGAFFSSTDSDVGVLESAGAKEQNTLLTNVYEGLESMLAELRNIKAAINNGADRQAGATTQAAAITSYSNQDLQKEVQLNGLTGVN